MPEAIQKNALVTIVALVVSVLGSAGSISMIDVRPNPFTSIDAKEMEGRITKHIEWAIAQSEEKRADTEKRVNDRLHDALESLNHATKLWVIEYVEQATPPQEVVIPLAAHSADIAELQAQAQQCRDNAQAMNREVYELRLLLRDIHEHLDEGHMSNHHPPQPAG